MAEAICVLSLIALRRGVESAFFPAGGPERGVCAFHSPSKEAAVMDGCFLARPSPVGPHISKCQAAKSKAKGMEGGKTTWRGWWVGRDEAGGKCTHSGDPPGGHGLEGALLVWLSLQRSQHWFLPSGACQDLAREAPVRGIQQKEWPVGGVG